MTIFWEVTSSGIYQSDPPARLVVDEYGTRDRVYRNPTNASLQRIIALSEYHGVNIADGQITVYGGIIREAVI